LKNTPPFFFAQFLRQAQILILEIRERIPVVKIFAFLELRQNLALFKGLVEIIVKELRDD
jgi:hypothetical protein